jgi:hypothetical protein
MSTQHKFPPGMVLVTQFERPDSKAFAEYIEYIDRPESQRHKNTEKHEKKLFEQAQKEMFAEYLDYADNKQKTRCYLFTADSDELTSEQKQQMKSVFETAQRNKSLMWKTILTFDNAWLEEQGIYDTETKRLDMAKMKQATRKAMGNVLKAENLDQTAVWTGDIHFNTDNIHVHIATVEPIPTREKIHKGEYKDEFKGKWKQSSLYMGKAGVVSALTQEAEINKQISGLIRGTFVGKLKESSIVRDKVFADKFLELYQSLPSDRKLWNYNNTVMTDKREQINEITKMFIAGNCANEFAQFEKLVAKQAEVYKRAYGDTDRANKYVDNKMADMYTRMGNVILKQCKQHGAEEHSGGTKNAQPVRFHGNPGRSSGVSTAVAQTLYTLKKAMKKEFDSIKNQAAYDRITREIEHEVGV